MLTLYGISASRAFRNLWLLEELGLDYRQEPVDYRNGGAETPELLALNPNGRIPVLRDGDLVLCESMAINLYLASRYARDGDLWPVDPAMQGQAYQWSFWVMTEVEQALLTVLMHKRVLPAERRDAHKLARNTGLLQRPFAILEQALTEHDWLLGGAFSVADLNVAAVLSWARAARMDLSDYPRLTAWVKACMARPAFRAASRKP
jgi:glutathione S-transferase